MHSRRSVVVALSACCLPLRSAWAYEDHPLLSGMAEYTIRSKREKAFDAFKLGPTDVYKTSGAKYDGPLTFEGKVTDITYSNPKGPRSKFEIFRNYQAAIEKLGGKLLSPPPSGDVVNWHVFRIERQGAAPVSVLLNVLYESSYQLVIVEHQAMTQTVQAGELAKQIEQTGIATLYINFDTNQAVLKDDGVAAVKEIAALLKQSPQLRLSIEGHTDNVGQAADNKKLSQARADAVMKAVVALGVDPKRLAAVGRGQDVPIADNRTDAGRAKNRRVELVKQG